RAHHSLRSRDTVEPSPLHTRVLGRSFGVCDKLTCKRKRLRLHCNLRPRARTHRRLSVDRDGISGTLGDSDPSGIYDVACAEKLEMALRSRRNDDLRTRGLLDWSQVSSDPWLDLSPPEQWC